MEDESLTILGGNKLSNATKDILMQDLKEGSQGIDFRPPRYSIDHKGLYFRLTADDSTKKSLEGVIVLKQKVRGMWKEGDQIPMCSSLDAVAGTEKDVENKRHCVNCRYNQWGSGKNGKGKVCKEMRRILLVENSGDLFPVMFAIAPTSLSIFDNFISALIHKKIPLLATNIKFTLERAEGGGFKYAKIKMELGKPLIEEQILKVAKIKEDFGKKFQTIDIEKEDYKEDGEDTFSKDDFPA